MIDWPETRQQLQLWLHQSWPFRVLAWVRMRGVPEAQGFDDFEPLTLAQHRVIAEHAPEVRGVVINSLLPTSGEKPMPSPTQILHARACIADSEREDNSLATRVDAAIQAIAFLDRSALEDAKIQLYLSLKYVRPPPPAGLFVYHEYVLALAKKLLSKVEHE